MKCSSGLNRVMYYIVLQCNVMHIAISLDQSDTLKFRTFRCLNTLRDFCVCNYARNWQPILQLTRSHCERFFLLRGVY